MHADGLTRAFEPDNTCDIASIPHEAKLSLDGESIGEVPGYQLLEEVGRGGMGAVYRARDLGLDRDVAVKILQDRFPADGPAALRFVEEARITGQLQHPGIPSVHQVGWLSSGRPFLAMKLIRGHTLAKLIEAGPVNYLSIFEAICHAVGYAHAHGVIHRDLKPANVMVGSFGEVQVMDWGLAKLIGSPGNEAATSEERIVTDSDGSETQTGSILGTPSYMSPEQARGEAEHVNQRSDVFGLGAILCTLITHKPPYVAEDAGSTWQLASQGSINEALARLEASDAAPEVIALARKCLAIDPQDRLADGSSVAAAVAMLRQEADERAKNAELERVRFEVHNVEQRKRRRVLSYATLAIGAVLALGSAISTSQWLRASREEARTHQALNNLLIEQERTADALKTVTAEQTKTQKALVELTAEKRNTVTALNAMTNDVVKSLFSQKQRLGEDEKRFLRTVIELYNQATRTQADTPEGRAFRAEGHFRVASMQQKLGDLQAAEANLVAARDARCKIVEEVPGNEKLMRDLSECHLNLGILYRHIDRDDLAEAEILASKKLQETLVREFPTRPEHRNDLAVCHINLASIYSKTNRLTLVEKELITAQTILKMVVAENPTVADFQGSLASSHTNLGNYYSSQKKHDLAEVEQLAARDLLMELIRLHPEQPGLRSELAQSHNQLGLHYNETGRHELAEKELSASRNLRQAIVQSYPAVPEHRNSLAGTLVNLAILKMDQNDYAEAARLLFEAEGHQRVALEGEPLNPTFRNFFRNNRKLYANCHLAFKDYRSVPKIVAEMVEYSTTKAVDLYEAGSYHAQCLKLIAADDLSVTKRSELEKQYAAAAMKYLQDAVKQGYSNVEELKKDDFLDLLRPREDFQRLLADLEKK